MSAVESNQAYNAPMGFDVKAPVANGVNGTTNGVAKPAFRTYVSLSKP